MLRAAAPILIRTYLKSEGRNPKPEGSLNPQVRIYHGETYRRVAAEADLGIRVSDFLRITDSGIWIFQACNGRNWLEDLLVAARSVPGEHPFYFAP